MAKKIILTVLIIVLTTAAVSFGVLYLVTMNDLSNRQTVLDARVRELSIVKVELANTKNALEETSSELAVTTSELVETRDELDDIQFNLNRTTSELETMHQTLSNKQISLEKVQNDLTVSISEKIELQADLKTKDDEINALNESIDLYRETFGEVFSGVEPHYVINDSIPPSWSATGPFSSPLRYYQMVNSPDAVNPAYEELLDFVRADITDTYRYVADYYMCGNYAETMHNNAEKAGIRAAVVFIRFEEGPGHASNSFLTTDRGLVYIDSTGSDVHISFNLDCIVNEMKIGMDYIPEYLFPSLYYLIPEDNPITDIEIYW
jgi:hypothetical protein